jgi:hypothetical protein
VALGQELLARLLKDVKRHEAGKVVNSTDSPYTTGATQLFNLLIRGVTHYPVNKWVIRYTANVSDTYLLFTEANSGLGTIYTTSEMISAIPSGRLRSTLGSISAPAGDDQVVWGWLKTAGSEVTAANFRVDVSAEYILGQHSVFLYA